MNAYDVIFNEFITFLKTYFPQIITLCGTLLGTTLGWFLKYLQDNIGGTEFCIEETEIFKDEQNSFGYNFKVFACNHSLKSKYIKEITLYFKNKKGDILKSTPKIDFKKDYFVRNKSDFLIVNLKHNEPNVFYLCNILKTENIQNYDNIEIVYKNEKGNWKNVKVNCSLADIDEYPNGSLFPN